MPASSTDDPGEQRMFFFVEYWPAFPLTPKAWRFISIINNQLKDIQIGDQEGDLGHKCESTHVEALSLHVGMHVCLWGLRGWKLRCGEHVQTGTLQGLVISEEFPTTQCLETQRW